ALATLAPTALAPTALAPTALARTALARALARRGLVHTVRRHEHFEGRVHARERFRSFQASASDSPHLEIVARAQLLEDARDLLLQAVARVMGCETLIDIVELAGDPLGLDGSGLRRGIARLGRRSHTCRQRARQHNRSNPDG